jgi:flavin-dependent dehydrogenase
MAGMKDNSFVDVLIVGAGPAGNLAALTLNSRGKTCMLVDAKPHGMTKPGEAIPPNMIPLFKQLGLSHLLESPEHKPYFGNKVKWGQRQWEERFFLKEVNTQGYLLNRSYFEDQLRQCVQARDIVVEVSKLVHIEQLADGLSATLQKSDGKYTIKARFVIDATGKNTSVGRMMGAQKRILDPLKAFEFKYTVAHDLPSHVHVESMECGWIYGIPTRANEVSVMVFTDVSLLPPKGEHQEFLNNALQDSDIFKELLKTPFNVALVKDLKFRDAHTACLDIPFGERWLATGDAAYSFDPISSYGIGSAMGSGYYGAHALADYLDGDAKALEVYRFLMEEIFQKYLYQVGEQYSLEKQWPDSPFWRDRQQVELIINK